MSGFYVRLDEESKTERQKAQRDATYEAAKVLRKAGYKCRVQEYFTGSSTEANAASIIIEGEA